MAKSVLGAIGSALGSAAGGTAAGATGAAAGTAAAAGAGAGAGAAAGAAGAGAAGAGAGAAGAAGAGAAGLTAADAAAALGASGLGEGLAGSTSAVGATMATPTGLTASMTPVLYSPGYSAGISAAPASAFADSSVLSTAGASPLTAAETPWWQTPMAKQAGGQLLQQGQKKLGESMAKPMPGAPALRLGGAPPQMNIVPADRLAWLRAFKLQG